MKRTLVTLLPLLPFLGAFSQKTKLRKHTVRVDNKKNARIVSQPNPNLPAYRDYEVFSPREGESLFSVMWSDAIPDDLSLIHI